MGQYFRLPGSGAVRIQGEKCKLRQRLSERKANLLTVGQDVAVHVNPDELSKSEIELPRCLSG
ncbi:MAG: hypothetical protein R3D26_23435 [Cyanobacteriota/Melainabacteria group bacterium]